MRGEVVSIFLLLSALATGQDYTTYDRPAGNQTAASQVETSDFAIFFQQNLDNTEQGYYTRETWARDWNNPPWGDGVTTGDRTVIMDYNLGTRSSRGMRWTFPEGTYSTNAYHGYQWRPPLGNEYYECYLTYSIMFKPGFDPVQGGKLPCLMGYPFTGQPEYDDGFYAGIMFKEGPKPVFYVYHHDMPGIYGQTWFWQYQFDVSTDIWYDITLRVVMNSVSASGVNYDGILEGYVNGELVGQKTGLRFRNHADMGVNAAVMQAFFGGGDESWATRRDEWMIIDNVYVWRYSEEYLVANPGVKRWNQANNPGDRIITPIDLIKKSFETGGDPQPEADTVAPSTPTGLVATDSTQSTITIRWNESTDNVGVAGYAVYMEGIKQSVTGLTNYVFPDLEPGTQYRFSVSAVDASNNESPRSSVVYAYTRKPDIIPPSAPTQLRVRRYTGYSIEIYWNAATDNIGIDRYGINLNGVNNRYTTIDTFFIVSGLDPDTDYTITVRAFDLANNPGPLSNEIIQRTAARDTQPPTIPDGLRVTEVTEKTITLAWNPSSDNVAVKEYRVFVNNELRETSSRTTETIAGLEPGLEYNMSVSAMDEADNESDRSSPISVKTRNEDVTTQPTLPTISIIQVEDKTISPSSITELNSLGYAELKHFGLEVSEKANPDSESLVLLGLESVQTVNDNRVTKGLQVLYNFSEGKGNTVKDISGNADPVDLTISREGLATEWLPGQGLRVFENTIISQQGSPVRIMDAINQSNEITLEAWIKQETVNQAGPARIMTLSSDIFSRAFTLGHEGNNSFYNYICRLTKSTTDQNGLPELKTAQNFTTTSLHHLVYRLDDQGLEEIYVNGIKLASDTRSGFVDWTGDYQFALANELTGERPWKGIYYLVALYDRALSQPEIRQNYNAGFGQIRFITRLDTLTTNVEYTLTPFASTVQGLIYGERKEFIYKNVLATDSLLAIYPNPNNGKLYVKIHNRDEDVKSATLRIADFSGNLHYIREIDLSEGLIETILEIELPGNLSNGFYTVILIAGGKSVAEKMVLMK